MLDKIKIGSETGESAAKIINKAIEAIDAIDLRPIVSPSVVKVMYEGNLDTNPFTDGDKAKLDGIDLSTKVDKEANKGLSEENFTLKEKDLIKTIPDKVVKKTGWELSENNYSDSDKYKVSIALTSQDLETPISANNKIATMADIPAGGGGGSVTGGYTQAQTDAKFALKKDLINLKLEDLKNMSGTATTGQVMVFDGANWVPATLKGGTY